MRILVFALCLLLSTPALAQQPELTIFHIRVGQGDATLQAVYQNDVIITIDGVSYIVSTARRFPVDE